MVSYFDNLETMLQLIKEFGNADVIKKLWIATFAGRRFEITRKRTDDEDPFYTMDILKQCCPLLNQPYYVSY